MTRSEKVFEAAKELYANTEIKMSKWMWDNHVQWVANKGKELASKYNADVEKVYCAALLHDLADSKYPRSHENFDVWSETKGKEILSEAGFNNCEASEIIEVIVRPHSCRPGNLPSTLEGRLLATADAMFHLQTSFFAIFCWENRPEKLSSYDEFQKFVDEKLDRDFKVKIFFEDERAEVEPDYQALSRVFRNRSLSSL